MPEARFGSPGQAGASAQPDDAHRRVPQAVEEAQVELNRLMDELSEEGQPGNGLSPLPRTGTTKNVEVEAGQVAAREADMRSAEQSAEVHCLEDVCPVYLIISSRRALTEKYGDLGFERLDSDLRVLTRTVEERAGLETMVFYVDDEKSLARYGLQPVDPTNPYKIKMLIDRVDAKLAGAGQAIRYLLIIGGDEIIPFHRLPNPVDDQDPVVPSDNLYACRDSSSAPAWTSSCT